MASKNLLPVTALCSALATGMPVAALATPAVDIPLPAVNCLATNQMSTIARQRFSLAQASISASGCLRRCTNSSIVVDTERSSTADGPLTGCIICTWRAAATDADGDSCDVELRLDITLSDDSADGATVAFDSTFFENGGGVCLGCVPSSADGTQPAISFTASLKMTKAGTDATANGEIALMFYASGTESQEIRGKQRTGSLSLTRGADPGPVDINAETQDVHHVLVDPALLEMEWSGVGAVGIAPSTGDIASDSSESSGEIAAWGQWRTRRHNTAIERSFSHFQRAKRNSHRSGRHASWRKLGVSHAGRHRRGQLLYDGRARPHGNRRRREH